MLTLRDVKYGDVIELYVKDIPAATDGLLEEVIEEGQITDRVISATVIYTPGDACHLAWLDGEERLFRSQLTAMKRYWPTKSGDMWVSLVRLNALVKSIDRSYARASTGVYCARCNLPNPYATQNRPNGTYVCYDCR